MDEINKEGQRESPDPEEDKAVLHQEKQRPATPDKPAREFEIDIFKAWCKSCGICVAFCPRKCLDRDEEGNPVITRPALCTGCGWCEIHCPDFAISVREKKVRRRQELNEEDDGV